MGNKKNKTTTLRGRKYGNFGAEPHGFLSFSPQIKNILPIEKKNLFKNPLFATKNAVFRRNVKKIFIFFKNICVFFEISLYLYIRNSRKT